ncbi:MAG: hypothetical protein WCJ58_08570 [bacterium]
MKRTFVLFIFILEFGVAFSQDRIIKSDGTEIISKVIEITTEFIKYKNYNQPDGPIRNAAIRDVIKIIYQDGTVEEYNKEIKSNYSTESNQNKKTTETNSKDSITNSKIIQMVTSGTPTSLILYNIQKSINHFNLSSERLIDMCDFGVPSEVILAMKNSKNNIPNTDTWNKLVTDNTITNSKIVKWSNIKIPSNFIIEKINNSIWSINTTADSVMYLVSLNTSVDSLLFLAENKVATEVINKIIEIDSKKQVSVMAEPIVPDVLTNKKIIKLSSLGCNPAYIKNKIQTSSNMFEINVASINELMKEGVAPEVIDKMMSVTGVSLAVENKDKPGVVENNNKPVTVVNSSSLVENKSSLKTEPIIKQNNESKATTVIEKSDASVNIDKLTNDDIIKLTQSRNQAWFIIKKIQNSDCAFDLSSEDITMLVNSNVSTTVIEEMKLKGNTGSKNTSYSSKLAKERLNNEKIINLTKFGIEASIIISKIQQSENEFDISPSAIINLKQKNVSDEVIKEMMRVTIRK